MLNDGLTQTWQYVDYWARKKPDAECLVFHDQRLTWGKTAAEIDRVAKAFLDLGVQRGDRIAFLAMAQPEFLITFMAANKVGAMWLGLSPKFKPEELAYIVQDAQPTILIALHDYRGENLESTIEVLETAAESVRHVVILGESPRSGWTSYNELTSDDRPHLDDALAARTAESNPHDNALLMYTSGSTGKPKGVVQTHASIIANIDAQVRYFLMEEDTRSLIHFPINHVAADVELGFGTIYGGGTAILMDLFDPVQTLETVERERITMFGQVPAMFFMEMAAPNWKSMDWSSVKAFLWGGACAPKELLLALQAIASQNGALLLTGYGSTELCGFVTYSKPADSVDLLASSAGCCPPEIEMRIVDHDRVPVATGVVGEIAVRGPMVMKEYFNNPAATALAKDGDGWYYTNDLAHIDADGNLHITGRKNEMYKSGGENVHPREVEAVLESIPEVLMAAVMGIPDPLFQEVGLAFVMPHPGKTITEEQLRAHCKEHLANFKVPKRYEIRPMLPLLPTGKVNKVALRATFAG